MHSGGPGPEGLLRSFDNWTSPGQDSCQANDLTATTMTVLARLTVTLAFGRRLLHDQLTTNTPLLTADADDHGA